MPNFAIPQSALSSLDVVMQATAHNIANVNTNGFRPQHVVLQSGPDDEGVRVGSIYRDVGPGPAVINHLSDNTMRDAVNSSAMNIRNKAENYDGLVAQDLDRAQQTRNADAWQADALREGQTANSLLSFLRAEPSQVDLPREFVNLAVVENAYSANAAVIRAWDELAGSIVDIKV